MRKEDEYAPGFPLLHRYSAPIRGAVALYTMAAHP